MTTFVPSIVKTVDERGGCGWLQRRSVNENFSKRQRCHRSIRTFTVPRVTLLHPGDANATDHLDRFAAAVRGEWRGYEGRFRADDARVKPVPDYYVPEEFSEWGVRPNGFETNHSIIVRGDKLFRKFLRILPSVSLFADHVDVEEDHVEIPLVSTDSISTASFPDGSFITGAQRVEPKRESLLSKWPALLLSIQDPRSEVRRAANVWVKFDFANGNFVDEVRVVVESWSDEFSDTPELEGSSGFVDGWVSEPNVDPKALTGNWHTEDDLVIQDGSDNIATKEHGNDEMARLLLPNGLDLSLQRDDNLTVQVGWLVKDDLRIVLRRCFAPDGVVLSSQRTVGQRAD